MLRSGSAAHPISAPSCSNPSPRSISRTSPIGAPPRRPLPRCSPATCHVPGRNLDCGSAYSERGVARIGRDLAKPGGRATGRSDFLRSGLARRRREHLVRGAGSRPARRRRSSRSSTPTSCRSWPIPSSRRRCAARLRRNIEQSRAIGGVPGQGLRQVPRLDPEARPAGGMRTQRGAMRLVSGDAARTERYIWSA